MDLLILCPQWGHEHLSPEAFLEKVKEAGFDGIDTWMPEEREKRKKFIQLVRDHKLAIVSHQHQANGDNITAFCRSFEYYLNVSLECEPLSINSHSGRDYFTLDEQLQILDTAFNFAAKKGIQVNHETHRGRMFFSPGNADLLFNARPEVTITADFSHWVCVAENLNLTGFEKIVDKAIRRAAHIHARVGFEEGPQVTDPRLPAWQKEVSVFLGWWDKIIEHQAGKGASLMTVTPEFGPFPYMWQLPGTGEPVASQWDINMFTKDLLKKRYATNKKSPDQPSDHSL